MITDTKVPILTGSKAVTEELGIKLENVKLEDFGLAKKVIIDKDNTTIIEGEGKADEIEGRIKQLRRQVEEAISDLLRPEPAGRAFMLHFPNAYFTKSFNA